MDGLQIKRGKNGGLRTHFVEHKNETSENPNRASRACVTLPPQSVTAPNEQDDVGLVDEFVRHVDVVCCSFVLLVAADVVSGESGRVDEMLLADADTVSWAQFASARTSSLRLG